MKIKISQKLSIVSLILFLIGGLAPMCHADVNRGPTGTYYIRLAGPLEPFYDVRGGILVVLGHWHPPIPDETVSISIYSEWGQLLYEDILTADSEGRLLSDEISLDGLPIYFYDDGESEVRYNIVYVYIEIPNWTYYEVVEDYLYYSGPLHARGSREIYLIDRP